MNKAVEVMKLLFSREKLPAYYKDHELLGDYWKGQRELHIGGDFLLVYEIDALSDHLTFIALGTHSELFG